MKGKVLGAFSVMFCWSRDKNGKATNSLCDVLNKNSGAIIGSHTAHPWDYGELI